MHEADKINRQVHFMHAQIFDPQDTSGDNNTWNYNRAPDGFKFILHSIHISGNRGNGLQQGIVSMYDGHEYTHWNTWPGVESRELLARFDSIDYQCDTIIPLNEWECKEYSLAVRSWSETKAYKACIIVWYYLRKMSWLEKLYYAVIQPKGDRYKKTLGVTVEPRESGII